jgi:hypothetical protein
MPLFLQSYSYEYRSQSPLMLIIFLIIFLIPAILYLITLQNTLKAISRENRTMEPGNVWLMLIPLFSIVWQFIVVNKIASSIRAELNARGVPVDQGPGLSIGLAMCVLCCVSIIPVIGVFFGLAAFICWIIYWIKIAGFKKQIESLPDAPEDDDSLIFGSKNY